MATSRPLYATFGALLLLTALSWGVSMLPLGSAEFPIAMLIAAVKAGLVLIFFMHLTQESLSTVLALVAGIFFVLLLALFVAAEVATRAPPPFLPPQGVE
jgi:cytochrome c oxidase subunit IV